jgi:Na+/phosphate symporter
MPGGSHPPLSVILSWPTPNYVDPVTRGWGDVILCVVLYALALFTVVARLWARLIIKHNAGLDDVMIVIAMVQVTGLLVDFMANLIRSFSSVFPYQPH